MGMKGDGLTPLQIRSRKRNLLTQRSLPKVPQNSLQQLLCRSSCKMQEMQWVLGVQVIGDEFDPAKETTRMKLRDVGDAVGTRGAGR